MKPKLPRRPKFLDVRKGQDVIEEQSDSKALPHVFESIVENVKSLERSRYELETLRATLIFNFGPEGKAGLQCGVVIPNACDQSNISLLVMVLEGLYEKAMKQ